MERILYTEWRLLTAALGRSGTYIFVGKGGSYGNIGLGIDFWRESPLL